MKRIYTFFIMALIAITASAYDIEVDGIYYNVLTKAKEAYVARGNYSGNITIPEKIIVDGIE